MRVVSIGFVIGVTLVAAASSAGAQQAESFLVAASAGVGGGVDGTLDDGFEDTALQLDFGMYTAPRQLLVFRLGTVGVTGGNGAVEGDLTYLTVAGEYRFLDRYYDSGIFLGLGAYDLEPDSAVLGPSETAVGVTLGVTGDFPVVSTLGVTVQLAGHWIDLDAVSVVGTATVGVSWRF